MNGILAARGALLYRGVERVSLRPCAYVIQGEDGTRETGHFHRERGDASEESARGSRGVRDHADIYFYSFPAEVSDKRTDA